MGRSAVLLLAHGTPDVLGEMAEYLGKVTGGRGLPQEVVEELQHRYAQIGLRETPGVEAPPLTKWTMTQGHLLEQALAGEKVYVGMRNWHPYIADVIAQMRMDGVTPARGSMDQSSLSRRCRMVSRVFGSGAACTARSTASTALRRNPFCS